MTDMATRRYQALRAQLLERPYASFWSGVTDAPREWAGTGIAQRPVILLYSDCCTDPQPTPDNPMPSPHVCGYASGMFWRYCLHGPWPDRHITLTEALGPALNALLLAPHLPAGHHVLTTAATAV
jgi:hypothetical protein